MQVLKANKVDLEAITNLNRLFHLDFPWFRWDNPKWVEKEIKNGNCYIIKNEYGVIAAMCLRMLKEEGCIETIAVQENKQKSGVGRRLIEFAIDKSKISGKSKLTVESFCKYGVKEFYEKCGFVTKDKIETFNGHPYYCFSMKL